MVDEASDVVTPQVLRAELAHVDLKLARLDVKVAELRTEMHEGFRRQQPWLVATALLAAGGFIAVLGAAITAGVVAFGW